MLYERTALSKQPDALIKQELATMRSRGEVTPALLLKDPYILDFPGLSARFLERDLEEAILRELETFLLEWGAGFSFLARQKRIELDVSCRLVLRQLGFSSPTQQDAVNAAVLLKQSLHFSWGEGATRYFSTHSKALSNNCASTPVFAGMEDRAANRASMICATPRRCID
jgi:hypothetical protein